MKRSRLFWPVASAMFAALLTISQLLLAGLPNVELVSLLVLVWTRAFGRHALPGIAVFAVLQGILYGFSIWWLPYLYVWFILWGIVMLIPRRDVAYPLRALGWGALSGAYGFAFGALSGIPWLITGGPRTFAAYVAAGIPFDVSHAIGNAVFALALAPWLIDTLTRLRARP